MIIYTLKIKTSLENREKIENIFLNFNASTSSINLNSKYEYTHSSKFITKAIFYNKPNLKKIEIQLSKIVKKINNLKLVKEVHEVNYNYPILAHKVIGKYYISENKNNNNFFINKNIIIPASTGFGTGHHPTTEGIIQILNKIKYLKKSKTKNIIDIGCGSGILTIILAKIYKLKIEGLDIDKLAINAAKSNIKINLVNYNTFIYKGSFTKKTLQNNYDLIVINILARPIMDMAINISNKLNKNGRVILSGILNTQIFMVANKFRKFGLIIDKNILINKWAIIILKTYVPPKL